MIGAYYSPHEEDRQAFQTGNSASSAKVTSSPYGYTSGGLGYLIGNTDSELNAVNQQALWDREDILRKEANEWDSHQLDRIVEAAKRNGINPIFLLDALSGGTSASYTTSAAKANSYDDNAKTAQANSAKMVGAVLAALAMVVAAAL